MRMEFWWELFLGGEVEPSQMFREFIRGSQVALNGLRRILVNDDEQKGSKQILSDG